MPHVLDLGLGLDEQDGAVGRAAVGTLPRRAVLLEHVAVSPEQGRVGAPAGEHPLARDAIAAVDRDGLALDAGAPGEHGIGGPEQAPRNLGLQVRGRHRAARTLPHAPCRAGVRAGDRLGHPGQLFQMQLVAAERARQQQPEHPRLVQRGDDIGGQRAPGLDPARCGTQRSSTPRARARASAPAPCRGAGSAPPTVDLCPPERSLLIFVSTLPDPPPRSGH